MEGEENEFIKIIAESKYNLIAGVHNYSAHATDLVSELVLAMNLKFTPF